MGTSRIIQDKNHETRICRAIKQNRAFGRLIERRIDEATSISDRLILLAQLAHHYTVNCSGIVSSRFIETSLNAISNSAMSDLRLEEPHPGTLHVLTEAYRIGGHTRIVEAHARLIRDGAHDVFIVNGECSIPESLSTAVAFSGGRVVVSRERGAIGKARELALEASRHSRIILHVHMWDVVPLLSFGNAAWDRLIYFTDHATHLFWLGVSVADVVLTDLPTDGELMIKRGVRVAEQVFVPIFPQHPHIQTVSRIELGIDPGIKVILSMAVDFKYSPADQFDFLEIVEKIRRQLGEEIHLIVIGGDPTNPYWQSRDLCISLIPATVEFAPYFSIADLYLDSVPQSSPMCYYEAIAHGLDAVTFQTPLFSLFDRGQSIEEGVRVSVAILRGELHNNSDLIEELAKRSFPESWTARMTEVFRRTEQCKHVLHPFEEVESIGPVELFAQQLLEQAQLPELVLY